MDDVPKREPEIRFSQTAYEKLKNDKDRLNMAAFAHLENKTKIKRMRLSEMIPHLRGIITATIHRNAKRLGYEITNGIVNKRVRKLNNPKGNLSTISGSVEGSVEESAKVCPLESIFTDRSVEGSVEESAKTPLETASLPTVSDTPNTRIQEYNKNKDIKAVFTEKCTQYELDTKTPNEGEDLFSFCWRMYPGRYTSRRNKKGNLLITKGTKKISKERFNRLTDGNKIKLALATSYIADTDIEKTKLKDFERFISQEVYIERYDEMIEENNSSSLEKKKEELKRSNHRPDCVMCSGSGLVVLPGQSRPVRCGCSGWDEATYRMKAEKYKMMVVDYDEEQRDARVRLETINEARRLSRETTAVDVSFVLEDLKEWNHETETSTCTN